MASKEEIRRIQEKALTDLSSLTEEEARILKYETPEPEKMIDTDDYNDAQVDGIKNRKAKGEKLSDEEETVLIGKKLDKQQNVLNNILHGYNDVFHKHYDYKEDGVSFDISIREPNIAETGRIVSMTSNYFEGLGNLVPTYWYNIFYTLSLIRVCGEKVPLELSSDEKMYSPSYAWLVDIGNDFDEWEKRFRS